jgi:hypothetical protein
VQVQRQTQTQVQKQTQIPFGDDKPKKQRRFF